MLDKELFKKGMNQLLLAFPRWSVKLEEREVAEFWYKKFKHLTDKQFNNMVEKYIENERFEPTIKGLNDWDITPRKSLTQINHEKMLEELRQEKKSERLEKERSQ